MGALPALDVFILAWSYEYIKNLVTFKVQITLDIDCKPKLNLLFKTMLKFLNKPISGILAGGRHFSGLQPRQDYMCLWVEECHLPTHQTGWLLGSFCWSNICPVEKHTDGTALFRYYCFSLGEPLKEAWLLSFFGVFFCFPHKGIFFSKQAA